MVMVMVRIMVRVGVGVGVRAELSQVDADGLEKSSRELANRVENALEKAVELGVPAH